MGTNTPQAQLDVSSTTSGFIPPRMTTAQRDSLAHVEGMAIYNTETDQLEVYTGSAWETVGPSVLRCLQVDYQYDTGAMRITYDSETGTTTSDLNVADVIEIRTSTDAYRTTDHVKGIAVKDNWMLTGCARHIGDDEDEFIFQGICGDTQNWSQGGATAIICRIE